MAITDRDVKRTQGEVGETLMEIRDLREALRRSEDVVHTVFDASAAALFMVQEGMAITLANRAGERLTGYSRREMEGEMGLEQLVPSDELPALRHYYEMRRDAPDSVARRFECTLVDRHDVRRPCLLCIDAVPGTTDCLASLLDTAAFAAAPPAQLTVMKPEPQPDVSLQAEETLRKELSAKRQLEDDLRAMEKKLSGILSFFPEATYMVDERGRVIAWNPAMEVLTGTPAAEVLGTDDHTYALRLYGIRCPTLIDLAIGTAEEIKDLYTALQKENGGWSGETELPATGGVYRHLLAKAAPLYDHQGTLMAAIESLRDITAEKQMLKKITELQTHLDEQEKQLNLSAARMQYALPQSSEKEGVGFLIDENGMIRGVSERFMKLLCRSRMELLGKKFFDFAESDCHGQIQAALRNALMDTPNKADIRLIGKPAPILCEIKLSRMYLSEQRLLLALMWAVNGKPY